MFFPFIDLKNEKKHNHISAKRHRLVVSKTIVEHERNKPNDGLETE